jgi:hypothetical protein
MNNHPNHKINSPSSTGAPKIYFKHALATVPVPEKLLKGVSIVKVEANGKSQEASLNISQDKFTIHIRSSEGNGVFDCIFSCARCKMPAWILRLIASSGTVDAN